MIRAQGRWLLLVAFAWPIWGSRPKLDLEASLSGFLGWEKSSLPLGHQPPLGGSDADDHREWLAALKRWRPAFRSPVTVRKRTSVYRWLPAGRCPSCRNGTPEASSSSSLASLANESEEPEEEEALVARPSARSRWLHLAAEKRESLADVLRHLLPTLCGGDNDSPREVCTARGVCQFPGVTCLKIAGARVPIALILNCKDFGADGVNGTRRKIPAGLWDQSFLVTLSFEDCPFEGPLPPEVAQLTMLEELKVRNTPLGGRLPPELGALESLALLSLDLAGLMGPIPEELGNLDKLTLLNLQGNYLGGDVPLKIGNLMDLTHLDLSSNHFEGFIPVEVGLLSNLNYLDLHNNRFEGCIPLTIAGLYRLRWLDLSKNGLEGRLPAGIANLTSLLMMDVSENSISGELPMSLGRLDNIDTFIISKNNVEGAIPEELSQWTHIKWLDLSYNQFRGKVPDWLGNLSNLTYLSVDENDLEGTIPATLGNLTELQYLGLSDNWLEGQMPPSLGNLQKLIVLFLADNMLSGVIPVEFSNMTNLVGLFLYSNRITGRIPPELAELKRLSFLALHENALYDEVPRLSLDVCSLQECPREMQLTLYGNHLSCRLPQLIDESKRKYLKAAVAHGNKFSLAKDGQVPKWLPPEAGDEVHFHVQGQWLKPWLTLLGGTVLWLLSMLLVLRLDALAFLRGEVFVHPRDHPEAGAHLELAALIFCMACVSLCVVLPACYCGSRFTKCGDELAHFSLTYLSRSPKSEGIVGLFMFVHLCLVGLFIKSLAKSQVRDGPGDVANKLAAYLAWLGVLVLAAALPVLYASIKVLPWDNSLKTLIGNKAYLCIYYGAPAASAVVKSIFVPILACKFADRMGLKVRHLITSSHFICSWSAPICAVVYMGEGCGKRWRLYWNECKTSDFDTDFVFLGKTIHVMTRNATCGIPGLERLVLRHNGGCSRDILEAVTPLLLQAAALEAVVFPVLYLLFWLLSKRSEDGRELQLRGLGMRVSFTVEEYYIQLDIWATTATFWGALVPLLQPLLLLAVSVSYVMNRLETRYFGCRSPLPPPHEAADAGGGDTAGASGCRAAGASGGVAMEAEELEQSLDDEGKPLVVEKTISKSAMRIAAIFMICFLLLFTTEMLWYE